jgi:hypothetical protein
MGMMYLQGMEHKNSGIERGKCYPQALESFKKSAKIYSIIHGEDHSFTLNVLQKLGETEAIIAKNTTKK